MLGACNFGTKSPALSPLDVVAGLPTEPLPALDLIPSRYSFRGMLWPVSLPSHGIHRIESHGLAPAQHGLNLAGSKPTNPQLLQRHDLRKSRIDKTPDSDWLALGRKKQLKKTMQRITSPTPSAEPIA